MPRKLTLLVSAMLLVFIFSGCDKIPFIKEEPPQPPSHLVFDDVLIPSELTLERENSFVFETKGLKVGTLYFKGYVDVDSLTTFFQASMPKDGWHLKSVFRHPKTVLLFEKPSKSCIIFIYEKAIYTYVEIWVAPQV